MRLTSFTVIGGGSEANTTGPGAKRIRAASKRRIAFCEQKVRQLECDPGGDALLLVIMIVLLACLGDGDR
jgi:hypothetical protein